MITEDYYGYQQRAANQIDHHSQSKRITNHVEKRIRIWRSPKIMGRTQLSKEKYQFKNQKQVTQQLDVPRRQKKGRSSLKSNSKMNEQLISEDAQQMENIVQKYKKYTKERMQEESYEFSQNQLKKSKSSNLQIFHQSKEFEKKHSYQEKIQLKRPQRIRRTQHIENNLKLKHAEKNYHSHSKGKRGEFLSNFEKQIQPTDKKYMNETPRIERRVKKSRSLDMHFRKYKKNHVAFHADQLLYYQYNDAGYMTERQVEIIEKIQQKALQAFYRIRNEDKKQFLPNKVRNLKINKMNDYSSYKEQSKQNLQVDNLPLAQKSESSSKKYEKRFVLESNPKLEISRQILNQQLRDYEDSFLQFPGKKKSERSEQMIVNNSMEMPAEKQHIVSQNSSQAQLSYNDQLIGLKSKNRKDLVSPIDSIDNQIQTFKQEPKRLFQEFKEEKINDKIKFQSDKAVLQNQNQKQEGIQKLIEHDKSSSESMISNDLGSNNEYKSINMMEINSNYKPKPKRQVNVEMNSDDNKSLGIQTIKDVQHKPSNKQEVFQYSQSISRSSYTGQNSSYSSDQSHSSKHNGHKPAEVLNQFKKKAPNETQNFQKKESAPEPSLIQPVYGEITKIMNGHQHNFIQNSKQSSASQIINKHEKEVIEEKIKSQIKANQNNSNSQFSSMAHRKIKRISKSKIANNNIKQQTLKPINQPTSQEIVSSMHSLNGLGTQSYPKNQLTQKQIEQRMNDQKIRNFQSESNIQYKEQIKNDKNFNENFSKYSGTSKGSRLLEKKDHQFEGLSLSKLQKKYAIYAKPQEKDMNNRQEKIKYTEEQQNVSKHFQGNRKMTSSYNERNVEYDIFTKIRDFLAMQQYDFHEPRKAKQNASLISQELEEVIACIEQHTYILNCLLEIVLLVEQVYNFEMIYSKDDDWILLQAFLSMKKHLAERKKVALALTSGKNCFHLSGCSVSDELLLKYKNRVEITNISEDLEECNMKFESILQSFYKFLIEFNSNLQQSPLISLKPFRDSEELKILLRDYSQEMKLLLEKKDEDFDPESISKMNEQQLEPVLLINERVFRLMEISFMLSDLAGKGIKMFQDQDQYFLNQVKFCDYLHDYHELFKQTIMWYQ